MTTDPARTVDPVQDSTGPAKGSHADNTTGPETGHQVKTEHPAGPDVPKAQVPPAAGEHAKPGDAVVDGRVPVGEDSSLDHVRARGTHLLDESRARVEEYLTNHRAEHPGPEPGRVPPEVLRQMAASTDEVTRLAAAIEQTRQSQGYVPTPEQVTAAEALLGRLNDPDAPGFVLQHGTGEGKTDDVRLLTVLRASREGEALVLTSSEALAGRDADEMREFLEPFERFDVVVLDPDTPLPPVPEGRVRVVFAAKNQLLFHFLKMGEAGGVDEFGVPHGLPKHVVVDEVDAVDGAAYLSPGDSTTPESQVVAVRWADKVITDGALTRTDVGVGPDGHYGLTKSGLDKLDQLETDLRAEGRELPEDAAERLARAAYNHWVRSEGNDYFVGVTNDGQSKIIIIDPESGEPLWDARTNLEQQWHLDHQALAAKHGLSDIPALRAESKQLTVQDAFGRLKDAGGSIVGLSGTAKHAEARLGDTIGARVVEIPSHAPSGREVGATGIFDTAAAKLDHVTDTVLDNYEEEVFKGGARHAATDDLRTDLRNGQAEPAGRPTAVIHHRNGLVEETGALLKQKFIDRYGQELGTTRFERDVITVNAEKLFEWDKTTTRDSQLASIAREAGRRGKILLINQVGGRGFDIKPFDNRADHNDPANVFTYDENGIRTGGVRSITTSHDALTKRQDLQRLARVGRGFYADANGVHHGNPGQTQFVLSLDDPIIANNLHHSEVRQVVIDIHTARIAGDATALEQAHQNLRDLIPHLQDHQEFGTPLPAAVTTAHAAVEHAPTDPAPETQTDDPNQHAPPPTPPATPETKHVAGPPITATPGDHTPPPDDTLAGLHLPPAPGPLTDQSPPADPGLHRVFDNLSYLGNEIQHIGGLRPVGPGWYQGIHAGTGEPVVIGVVRGDTGGPPARTTHIGPADVPSYLITVPGSPTARLDDPNLRALSDENVEVQVARQVAILAADPPVPRGPVPSDPVPNGPDSLRAGHPVQPTMSPADHAAATEIRVRARQLDTWQHATAVRNPLIRLRGGQAREQQLQRLIGRTGLADTSPNVAQRRQLLIDNGYGDVVDIAQAHTPSQANSPDAPAPADQPVSPRVDGPLVLHADHPEELRQVWERAVRSADDPTKVTIAVDPSWVTAAPGHTTLLTNQLSQLADDTLVTNPGDLTGMRITVNPRYAALLRDNPELADLLRDPELAQLLSTGLAEPGADPQLPGLLATARGSTNRADRLAVVRRLADITTDPQQARAFRVTAASRPDPALADLALSDSALDELINRLLALVEDAAQADRIRRLNQLTADPDYAGLLTGHAVVAYRNLGDPVVVSTTEATDEDILNSDAPVDEQPDVVVFIGDHIRAAQLADVATQARVPAGTQTGTGTEAPAPVTTEATADSPLRGSVQAPPYTPAPTTHLAVDPARDRDYATMLATLTPRARQLLTDTNATLLPGGRGIVFGADTQPELITHAQTHLDNRPATREFTVFGHPSTTPTTTQLAQLITELQPNATTPIVLMICTTAPLTTHLAHTTNRPVIAPPAYGWTTLHRGRTGLAGTPRTNPDGTLRPHLTTQYGWTAAIPRPNGAPRTRKLGPLLPDNLSRATRGTRLPSTITNAIADLRWNTWKHTTGTTELTATRNTQYRHWADDTDAEPGPSTAHEPATATPGSVAELRALVSDLQDLRGTLMRRPSQRTDTTPKTGTRPVSTKRWPRPGCTAPGPGCIRPARRSPSANTGCGERSPG